ncbi:hypothetical protein CPT_Sansa26 [Caulobacter phage Sansa]|uniref:Uncharacterized protein n=1 Tax=Caulobacter phage Sansa TaxID=1675600 RepID=A0A0K1LMS4_9CAUD|nr:hypothetical protein HOR07_gp026 [Caulobacter phage Sansa]AKU43430.1 hypothetical protein CPT_Sansa26 [Caulobacter phage Sansa]
MSTVTPESVNSYPAAADFSALKWPRLAVINSSRNVALCGAGARPDGMLENNPEQGDQARIRSFAGQGQWKAEAGGTFAAGVDLASDASGRLVAAATGNQIVGTSNEAGVLGRVVGFKPDLKGAKP